MSYLSFTPARLVSVGVNVAATGTTNLYTVPAGRTLIVTDIVARVTAASTPSGAVTLRIGKTAAFTEWLAASALTGLDANGKFLSLGTLSLAAVRQTFAAAEVLAADVTIALLSGTMTVTLDVFGYLV